MRSTAGPSPVTLRGVTRQSHNCQDQQFWQEENLAGFAHSTISLTCQKRSASFVESPAGNAFGNGIPRWPVVQTRATQKGSRKCRDFEVSGETVRGKRLAVSPYPLSLCSLLSPLTSLTQKPRVAPPGVSGIPRVGSPFLRTPAPRSRGNSRRAAGGRSACSRSAVSSCRDR